MPDGFYPERWVAVRKDLESGQSVGHGEQDRARPCIIVRVGSERGGRRGVWRSDCAWWADRGRHCEASARSRPHSQQITARRARYAEHVTVLHDVIAHIPTQFDATSPSPPIRLTTTARTGRKLPYIAI